MSTRIDIPQRIVERVRVPVEALRIPRVGDERIRLQEPSQRGSVRPRAVVVEAQGGLLPLPGEDTLYERSSRQLCKLLF